LKSIKPISYRVGWLASLFASDYQSLSLADDGIVLAGRESVRIPYLAISLGTTVEQGLFWNALLIPLENGDKLRFSGVTKKKSESLQEALNHQCRNYIKAYYQRIFPDLQQAYPRNFGIHSSSVPKSRFLNSSCCSARRCSSAIW